MKRYLTFVAFLATAILATASPETELLQSKTTALWQSFKDRKSDDFKKLCSPDYRSLYADGLLTVPEELKNMSQIELKSFSLSAFNVVMWNPDSALVTYKARADGSAVGRHLRRLQCRNRLAEDERRMARSLPQRNQSNACRLIIAPHIFPSPTPTPTPTQTTKPQ